MWQGIEGGETCFYAGHGAAAAMAARVAPRAGAALVHAHPRVEGAALVVPQLVAPAAWEVMFGVRAAPRAPEERPSRPGPVGTI